MRVAGAQHRCANLREVITGVQATCRRAVPGPQQSERFRRPGSAQRPTLVRRCSIFSLIFGAGERRAHGKIALAVAVGEDDGNHRPKAAMLTPRHITAAPNSRCEAMLLQEVQKVRKGRKGRKIYSEGRLCALPALPALSASHEEKSSGLTCHRCRGRPEVWAVVGRSHPALTRASTRSRVCSASRLWASALRRMSINETSFSFLAAIHRKTRRLLAWRSLSPICLSAARPFGQK